MAGNPHSGHSQSPIELMSLSELKLVPLNLIPKGNPCYVDTIDDIKRICRLSLLMEFFCQRENGIGLSAVQLGIPLNLFIVKFDPTYRFFINCSYEPISEEKEKSVEGCLSIKKPNGEFRYFEVDRFSQIKVKGKEFVELEMKLVDIEVEPTELPKIIFQHEIDHQNGILISDIGKEVYVWKK